jgi:hypothetical protein
MKIYHMALKLHKLPHEIRKMGVKDFNQLSDYIDFTQDYQSQFQILNKK